MADAHWEETDLAIRGGQRKQEAQGTSSFQTHEKEVRTRPIMT